MLTTEIFSSTETAILFPHPKARPDARWHQALDLEERTLGLVRGAALLSVDDERATLHLLRWRGQPPFADDDTWRRRLAASRLTPELFQALAGETPDSLAERTGATPPWLVEIEHAWAEPFEPVPWPDGARFDGTRFDATPSLSLAEPFAGRAWRRLVTSLEDVARRFAAPFDPHLAAWMMLGHLPSLLSPMIGPVLTGEGLERQPLHDPETAAAVLRRYPVLARELVRRIGQWENTSLEMLTHLATDVAHLRRALAAGDEIGTLIAVRPLSEPQRNGRRSCELRFDSGLRLVYQPRSMALDRTFQSLLRWVGGRGFEPAFRPLAIVDRGDHGWRHFIEESPHVSRRERRFFHLRHGAHLALLDLLGGRGFRPAKLIAAGEHPTLIDFETLFHPPYNSPHGARGPAEPRPRLDEYGGVLTGAAADLREGFERLCRLLARHRDELLAPRGPLAAFADAEVRVRVRPASSYAKLLEESFAPRLLTDGLVRQRHFDRLWAETVERRSVERRSVERLIPAEDADLRRGDQPYFTSRPGSRDLWTSRGERYADFFAESALSGVQRRLERLGAENGI